MRVTSEGAGRAGPWAEQRSEDSEVGPPQAALRWLKGQDGVLSSCQDRVGCDCRYIESQRLPGLGGVVSSLTLGKTKHMLGQEA